MPNGGGDGSEVPWARYIAATRRYKWLILLLTIAGVCTGIIGVRFLVPEYQASATVWVAETSSGNARGPIRAEELLSIRAWPELIRSFAILDKVVHRERLFLHLEHAADSAVFSSFGLANQMRPGEYDLHVSPSHQLTLVTTDGMVLDSGAVGDSIGEKVGFLWRPEPQSLRPETTVRFEITTIRGAAARLRDRVTIQTTDRSSLLSVSLTGSEPEKVALTLNALLDEFVATAAELKKRSLVENAAVLREQLDYAYRELQAAELEYETFRVNTITLPSEGTAVAAGVEITRDPVFNAFFEQRVELDRTRRDLESLERFLASDPARKGDFNSLWGIPAVETYGEELRAALNDLATKEAALRAMRAVYTSEHPTVREAERVIAALRSEFAIPLIATLASQLRERKNDLDARLAGTSRELRQIPIRTIEEQRLIRNVAVRENLYTLLKNRFEEARLAEASSLPDLSILDRAAPPQVPTGNTGARLILLCAAGGLALALALALLLDRFDHRVRYPDQITREMGLVILGAVPVLSRKAGGVDVQAASQVVESFRSIRLSLFHALGGHQPLQFAVSSPGIGEGKSLVSANLALAFAEVGYATLLIDGDIRRGGLHKMFGVERRPGLLDCLGGAASLDSVLKTTGHSNLTILPSGTRQQNGPELLMGSGLARMMGALRGRYDVIIVDTPPLGASIDPFALGAAAGNMVLVMRSGETDRKMAMAKLEILDRLPIRLVGAVLNDIESTGAYKYYSYLDGYEMEEEADARAHADAG
jgi:capsular exopolysaccharide synthesis family protein